MNKTIDRILYIFFTFIKTLIKILPRPFCLLTGHILGILLFRLDGKHRKIALTNMEIALGIDFDENQRLEMARRAFIHFGRVFFDLVKLSQAKPERLDKLLTLKGGQTVREALAHGNGALLFSAHFGNWEMAPALLSRIGPLKVVARPLDNALLERQLLTRRNRFGAEVISKFNASKQVLRALRDNEMVAILIDQNVLRSEGVFVDFFGKPASTTPSLAMFHLRTGAPLLPVFCYPSSHDTYSIEVGEPLNPVKTGDTRQDVLKITQLCTKIIESKIRKNPDFWFWFHQRWKSRPEPESFR